MKTELSLQGLVLAWLKKEWPKYNWEYGSGHVSVIHGMPHMKNHTMLMFDDAMPSWVDQTTLRRNMVRVRRSTYTNEWEMLSSADPKFFLKIKTILNSWEEWK